MSTVQDAILLASQGHSHDRWGDHPYMTHLALVAKTVSQMEGADESTVIVAWLHDLYEDHPQYEDEIRSLFGELWPSIKLLAHAPDVPYLEYVQMVVDSGDRHAILVKQADLLVNLGNKPPKPGLHERYRAALELFEDTEAM